MNYLPVLVKPASAVCNLECSYCFYHNVSENRETASFGIMEKETVDALIRRVFVHIKPPGIVTFMFQGGEPCMAGIAYYEYFLEKAAGCCPDGIKIEYSIQTNGTLVDEEWCKLFKEHNFLIGLSQDGPAEIHNKLRYGKYQKTTHEMTMQAIGLFRDFNIEFHILTVITKEIAENPRAVYEYYRKNNICNLQFIPCLNPLEGRGDAEFALDARAYGQFLKELFTQWYTDIKKGYYLSIRSFDNIVWMLRGRYPEMCGLDGKCHVQFVIEADGSVYPCDFYVLDEYRGGNIREDSLEKIRGSQQIKYFMGKKCPQHSLCENCKVRVLCNGGCRRYQSFYEEVEGYCPNQDFLYHTYSKFAELV